MLTSVLRRSGGSLIMTIPQAYAEQNMLQAGSLVAIEIAGEELKLKPTRKRKTLLELLAATPEGLHRIEGWDAMPQVGAELGFPTEAIFSISSVIRPVDGNSRETITASSSPQEPSTNSLRWLWSARFQAEWLPMLAMPVFWFR